MRKAFSTKTISSKAAGEKRRRNWLCLLLGVILALGLLAGCSKNSTGSTQENASTLKTVSGETEHLQTVESGPAEDELTESDPPPEGAAQGGGAQGDAQQIDAEPAIDEDGSYTTKEDVALYIHTYGKLPSNFITKKQAEKLGWSGGSLEPYAPGKCIGGGRFGNYEGNLPDGNYKECDIDTLGKKKRGAKRLVYSDDGRIYYTDDHYESFTQLY